MVFAFNQLSLLDECMALETLAAELMKLIPAAQKAYEFATLVTYMNEI